MSELDREVAIKEEESVKAEAIEREFDAREHDDRGVLGEVGEAAEADEAYGRAARAEEALEDGSAVAQVAAEDADRIGDAADKA